MKVQNAEGATRSESLRQKDHMNSLNLERGSLCTNIEKWTHRRG